MKNLKKKGEGTIRPYLFMLIPEIARADVDKAITYDEFFVTVCEPNYGGRIAYLAYISGAVVSPDDLYTTTCKEQSLEGLQRVGDIWESAERPLRTYLVTKVKESSGCDSSDNGKTIDG